MEQGADRVSLSFSKRLGRHIYAQNITFISSVMGQSTRGDRLVVALSFGHADGALAASGGRMGGGSFPRTKPHILRSTPPMLQVVAMAVVTVVAMAIPVVVALAYLFLFPFFSIGGGAGGLFSILIFLAIANFLVQSFRRSRSDDDSFGYSTENPTISVAKLQVGLLAEARELQSDLNKNRSKGGHKLNDWFG